MIYHITSTSWNGYIELEFNELGLMTRSDITQAGLNEAQQIWFLKNCRELSELQRVIKGTTATLTEVKEEITFDKFWERYNEKIKSSKKKALTTWLRLPKPEQIKAYNHIKKYEANISPGVAKKYAETYLNAELWNN
jgi:hypothetical protein